MRGTASGNRPEAPCRNREHACGPPEASHACSARCAPRESSGGEKQTEQNLPAQQSGAPGQATAETAQQHGVSAVDAASPIGFVHGDRDRCG